MKKVWIALLLVLCMTVACLQWLGLGLYSSSSAVSDLKAELDTLYGREYIGKAIENGTEDMEFVIEPKSWFLTNWNLRNTLGIDYSYECRVIFTTHTEEGTKIIRTVTYQAFDPMGSANRAVRAHLDPDCRMETTVQYES